jgi:hypothetical protein
LVIFSVVPRNSKLLVTIVQDHPKDAEFLNCPIRLYTEMEAIFGGALAIGKYALGSGESLGPNQNDSVAARVEGTPLKYACEEKTIHEIPSSSKATEILTTSSVGVKRNRSTFTEDEKLLLTNMSDVVNNVAHALRETGPAHVDGDLYLAVMESLGFSDEALIVAYTYLLDNKGQGKGFVGMSESHRALWLRTFLAKDYFV